MHAPEWLDADMTPGDILDTLARLQFRARDGLCLLEIDRGARDYLIAAVKARGPRRERNRTAAPRKQIPRWRPPGGRR
jgi:hypothetical protein